MVSTSWPPGPAPALARQGRPRPRRRGEGRLAGRRVVLAPPATYMNVSGGPVRGLLDYYCLPAEDLVVVHDELDLAFGRAAQARRRRGRAQRPALDQPSAGTKDYLRVRVGIGRPPGRQDPADFVLKDFSADRAQGARPAVAEAADAVEAAAGHGLEAAQNLVHVRD